MEPPEESQNAQNERQCVETFLNWHNKRFKTGFDYERAETVFPEIANSTRWDYIVQQSEGCTWYAIEIKRLIKPETRIRLVQWNGFLRNIKTAMGNHFQGEFLVYGVPHSLKLEKQERTRLKRILIELLLQNIASLKSDEMVDLGPQILQRFKEWPSTPHINTRLSPPIEYKVNGDSQFTLHKISNVGCSLELGFAQSGVFFLDQAAAEALSLLFSQGEMSQANTQLALAKQKGATETILLLDYDLPSWYPNHVRQVLSDNQNSPRLTDINHIYLVKASEDRVSKVRGEGGDISV